MVNGWKTTAWIFILLFLAETFLVLWMVQLGIDNIQKEEMCRIDICGNMENVTSYWFEEYGDMCYCLDVNEEIIHEQFID